MAVGTRSRRRGTEGRPVAGGGPAQGDPSRTPPPRRTRVDGPTEGPKDLYKALNGNTYRDAIDAGMNLSAFLYKKYNRAHNYKDGLDPFSRLLKIAGIRTRPIQHLGVPADTLRDFLKDDHKRALFPEWALIQWRRVSAPYGVSGEPQIITPGSGSRALYTNVEGPAGSMLRPYISDANIRYKRLAPPIPLSELVAITTPIQGTLYRAAYLTDDLDNERTKRIPEATEIPRAKLTAAERPVVLKKYGRGLELSYEEMQYMRLDLVSLHIARLAVQTEIDKVSAGMDILINGDGNAATGAIAYNLASANGSNPAMDAAATPGTLTLKGWLNFKMQFPPPYTCTTVLAQSATVLQMQMLSTGTANIPLVYVASQSGWGGFRSINPGLADNVAVGWTADAPVNTIVAFDNRWALEMVTAIGSNINEIEKFISRQTEAIFMSEIMGFDKFDQNAVRTLNLAA